MPRSRPPKPPAAPPRPGEAAPRTAAPSAAGGAPPPAGTAAPDEEERPDSRWVYRSMVEALQLPQRCERAACRRARRCRDPKVACFFRHRSAIREVMMPPVLAELRRRGMIPAVPPSHVPKFRLPEPDELPPLPPYLLARRQAKEEERRQAEAEKEGRETEGGEKEGG